MPTTTGTQKGLASRNEVSREEDIKETLEQTKAREEQIAESQGQSKNDPDQSDVAHLGDAFINSKGRVEGGSFEDRMKLASNPTGASREDLIQAGVITDEGRAEVQKRADEAEAKEEKAQKEQNKRK